MTNGLSRKLKLLFVPFLIIAICIICGYTLFNWFIFIRLHIFSLNEEISNLLIPIALPWVPLIIWLRPKIKLLKLKRTSSNPVPDYTERKLRKGDPVAAYIFIAGAIIIIPTAITQSYLETATGKLTRLDNISKIQKHDATKYYILKHFYIDKTHTSIQKWFDISGKGNTDFNMHLYLVAPILSSPADTSDKNCFAWYGAKYHKTISGRLGETDKEEYYKKFVQESQADFLKNDVARIIYFDKIGNTDEHNMYIAAIKNNKTYTSNITTVLIPINEPFEARNGNKLVWLCVSLGIGMLVWLLMIATPEFYQ